MNILHDIGIMLISILLVIITAMPFIIILSYISSKLLNNLEKLREKEETEKAKAANNEKAEAEQEKTGQVQQTPPQVIYIKQKQNGCVTLLIVVSAICVILYFLAKILERVGTLYILFNSTN